MIVFVLQAVAGLAVLGFAAAVCAKGNAAGDEIKREMDAKATFEMAPNPLFDANSSARTAASRTATATSARYVIEACTSVVSPPSLRPTGPTNTAARNV